ncbi:MAG: hypothetical protein ACPLQO_00155 [Desulfotomaculales bacterium]
MRCKQCGSLLVYGRSKLLRRRVRLCTRCGRADFLDWATGLLRVLWPGRWRAAG